VFGLTLTLALAAIAIASLRPPLHSARYRMAVFEARPALITLLLGGAFVTAIVGLLLLRL
jgi:hypothetical protein